MRLYYIFIKLKANANNYDDAVHEEEDSVHAYCDAKSRSRKIVYLFNFFRSLLLPLHVVAAGFGVVFVVVVIRMNVSFFPVPTLIFTLQSY